MFFSCTSCIYLIFAAPIFAQTQFFLNLFFAAHIFERTSYIYIFFNCICFIYYVICRVLFIYFYCTCLIIVYHQLIVCCFFLTKKKKESNAAIIIYLECTLYLYKYYLLLYFTIETRWKIITVFSVREKK